MVLAGADYLVTGDAAVVVAAAVIPFVVRRSPSPLRDGEPAVARE